MSDVHRQSSAESLPLESNSVDLMTVVTAIHWFDAQPFLLETRRVLQPGGTLAVLWTRREEVVVQLLTNIITVTLCMCLLHV